MKPEEAHAWRDVLTATIKGYDEELQRVRAEWGRSQDLRNELVNDLNRIRSVLGCPGASVDTVVEKIRQKAVEAEL